MGLTIRPATPADVKQILKFIRDLATYEREPDAVVATEEDLLRHGFGENPYLPMPDGGVGWRAGGVCSLFL